MYIIKSWKREGKGDNTEMGYHIAELEAFGGPGLAMSGGMNL